MRGTLARSLSPSRAVPFAVLSGFLVALAQPAAAQTSCGTSGVTVRVDPPVAAVGQAVQVTIQNDSSETIHLPSSCVYGAFFPGTGCAKLPVFTPLCLAVLVPVPPGTSATSTWLQTDDFLQQVPSGPYSVTVSYWDSGFTQLLSCCVDFSISGSCAKAASSLRNGSGVNPVNLPALAPPRLGLTWVAPLDCSGHAPALAGLFVFEGPVAGVPTSFGEVLVGGRRYGRFLQAHNGSTAVFSLEIPTDVSLCGLTAPVQGVCFGSPGPRLSNALDVVLGT